jgi:outer membrane protein assembly factor BamB/tRNA A-37 threonylcarbamoyl transferase component Bud32
MPETHKLPVPVGANDSAQDTALQQNSVLHNRYRILGVIGGGGMGTVYQARDLNFTEVRKLVAVKEMHTIAPDPTMRASMVRTFQREANILASLSHPAIPKIFDFFDLNDRVYIVMEYINGSDLELILQKTKELPVEKLIEWAIELCDVLFYLHEQKPQPIVFRDMKPSNIMIDGLGKVRLIDFGIAKAFVSGTKNTMIGTEGYSAPEQYKGEISPQSDIFSLGATMHHLLTRKDPRIEQPFSFHERPIGDLNPNASPALIAIVNRALAFNPGERYRSCAEMKTDLESLRHRAQLAALPVVAPSAPSAPSATPSPAASGVSIPSANGVQPTSMFEDVQTDLSGMIQPRWKFKTEDEIRSSPVAYKDMALVGSYDRNVWALKLDSGDLVWKFATRGGIASSPIVDESNRYVMFGSEDYSYYALDLRNGRVSWTFATKDRVRGMGRIAHDHAFFGSDDGKIYAVSALNGRLIWSFDTGAPVRCRPFVTNDLVIVGSESGEIIGLSLSGTRKWSYRTKRSVMSSPLVDMNEGVCYVGSSDGFMYALDATTGLSVWRFRTPAPIISAPALYKNLVIFGSADGYLYALNAQTGREKWKFRCEKPIVASPIVHRDSIYFGGTDQNLYCIDAEFGKERWKFKTGGSITATPSITGDILLIGSMDHTLYALPLVM